MQRLPTSRDRAQATRLTSCRPARERLRQLLGLELCTTPRQPELGVEHLSRSYDSVGPTVTLSSIAPDPTNTSPIPVTVTLNESSSDFWAGTLRRPTRRSRTSPGLEQATRSTSCHWSGNSCSAVAAGTLHDALGNPNSASNTLSRLYDSVGPTVTLSSVAPNPTNTSPIPVSVTLNESSSDFRRGTSRRQMPRLRTLPGRARATRLTSCRQARELLRQRLQPEHSTTRLATRTRRQIRSAVSTTVLGRP